MKADGIGGGVSRRPPVIRMTGSFEPTYMKE